MTQDEILAQFNYMNALNVANQQLANTHNNGLGNLSQGMLNQNYRGQSRYDPQTDSLVPVSPPAMLPAPVKKDKPGDPVLWLRHRVREIEWRL